MAVFTANVTITGSTGSSAGLTITSGTDGFGSALASTFASSIPSLVTQLVSTPSTFYTLAPGSSFLVVEDNLGFAGIIGKNGSSNVLVGDGTSFAYFGPTSGSASGSIVGGSGNDVFSSGIGNDTVALGGGSNFVFDNAGIIDSAGNNDTVEGGSGAVIVTITGSNSYAKDEHLGGSMTVHDESGTNTTVFSGNNTVVYGASVSGTTIDVGGNTTVFAGSGGTTFLQSAGAFVLNGSAGETDNITVSGGGPDTLYGASGAVINLTSTIPGNVFVANDPTHTVGGAVSLNGANASGGNQFWAGSGNATLIGGAGTDTMVAGHGASTLTGGSGASNYFDLFASNGGSNTNVTITDFGAAAGNKITLFNYGASQVAAAIAESQVQTGTGQTVLNLSDGTKITLQGYTGGLNSSNLLGT